MIDAASRFVVSLAVVVAATTASAQPPTPADSVDHVRAALEKPASKLMLKERVPDFSVHIEKRRPMQDIFDVPPWQLEPHGWQPPATGFDLLSVARYVARNVSDAKRGRDERLAREEVQRSIDDYCAAQEDGGAHIVMCGRR